MVDVVLRIFLFTIFPVLLGGLVVLVDRSCASRERQLEAVLVFLFAIGVAGSGIFNFIAHFFFSDVVAESIGWAPGSPFQHEVAFANLAIGALGLVAVSRRDGFREATVIALTVFGVGATIVHLMDIAATGNLAPGNTVINVGNLLKPALLIGFLLAGRRADSSPRSEAGTPEFDRWRATLDQAAAPMTAVVTAAYSLGFWLDRPWLMTVLGSLLAAAIMLIALARSPWHELGRGRTT